jgi:hypothetical protein
MSDDARDRQRSEDRHASEGQRSAAEAYEPPRIEDIPADAPAVTAAGEQGNVLVQASID